MDTITSNIETLSMELNGIRTNLFIIANLFGNNSEKCQWNNDTVCETLNSLSLHIGRISEQLADMAVKEN